MLSIIASYFFHTNLKGFIVSHIDNIQTKITTFPLCFTRLTIFSIGDTCKWMKPTL